ncbi:MAG: hypothetical protein K1060chlam5_00136 [Candidatus Anoxychlamydiales bacterium]|nr:hypothetical protein [Candidatus Anoxychlamydiales bacterium]
MFFLKIKKNILILLLLIFASCASKVSCPDKVGCDELVMDSYKIKEGKSAILEMQGFEIASLDPTLLKTRENYIENLDVLNIFIYHPKRKDLEDFFLKISNLNGFIVKGYKIDIPNIDSIDVKNLTLDQANKKIENRIKQELEDVKVFTSYKTRNTQIVKIAGLSSISTYDVDGKKRLFDLLSDAKLPIHANLFKSYIIRDKKFLNVDFYKLLKEGDMSYNIVLKSGDKVYIASDTSNIAILGEVKNPNVINATNGFMPIKEAIAKAGGITSNADSLNIQVIRGSIVNPKIYLISFKHILYLRDDALLLMPGDIVYVSTNPIANWNKFVSQMLPTVGIVNSAVQGFKNLGLFINE